MVRRQRRRGGPRARSVAQLGHAKVVGVKGIASIERRLGGFPDEIGCCLIRFAKPERQHVMAPDPGVRDFANARRKQ
jgi:hypothetical protein